jgi:hypothetical protein
VACVYEQEKKNVFSYKRSEDFDYCMGITIYHSNGENRNFALVDKNVSSPFLPLPEDISQSYFDNIKVSFCCFDHETGASTFVLLTSDDTFWIKINKRWEKW